MSYQNDSSVRNINIGLVDGGTKIVVDNQLVKSLDTISTFTLTGDNVFTAADVGKHYLYLGNEAGYVTNGIYKIVDNSGSYEPLLIGVVTQASNVSITDSGDKFTSTNVEGALQELATAVGSANDLLEVV